MVDRNNVQDVYSVIKDDFTWMLEDMEQQYEVTKTIIKIPFAVRDN